MMVVLSTPGASTRTTLLFDFREKMLTTRDHARRPLVPERDPYRARTVAAAVLASTTVEDTDGARAW
jgi:hypothetical protein